MLVLVGGFGAKSSSMVLRLDITSGKLSTVSFTAATGISPAYFNWQPTASPPDWVCVTNHGKTAPGTGITAVRWLPDGSMEPVEPVPGNSSSSGFAAVPDPDHVAVSPSGNWVLSTAYDHNNITITPVVHGAQPGQLALGKFISVETGAAPHEVKFDPSGRFVYVPCLGSSWIEMFKWDDASGMLTPLIPDGGGSNRAKMSQGAGPRHLAFHPTAKGVAYTIDELANTVSRWDRDPETGILSADFAAEPRRIVSTLAPGTPGGCPIRQKHTGLEVQAASEIAIPADGRFVYVTNRGEQGGISNVAIFAVSPDDGSLTPLAWEDGNGRVQFPRMLSLTPDDAYLLVANQDTDSITVFRRDAATGLLTVTDHFTTKGTVIAPTYVQVVPSAA